MILGIDASNLRSGGGVTHLRELLSAAHPERFGFEKVVVWSGSRTAATLPLQRWLVMRTPRLLDMVMPVRAFWQRYILPRELIREGCSLLFVPGGTDRSKFSPMVTMSRNMLPFELDEMARYGVSSFGFKLKLLRRAQVRTFERAAGLVFLTEYARDVVQGVVGIHRNATVIPHGVSRRFFGRIRSEDIRFNSARPCRVLYVSTIDRYKHQVTVVQAVSLLRDLDVPIELDLVGSGGASEMKSLMSAVASVDPGGEFVRVHSSVRYDDVVSFYHQADICVFASTCENMPNILLESMASGAPVVSSTKSPMPEVLGDAGLYFDPVNPSALAGQLGKLVASADLRAKLSQAAQARARLFDWETCAQRTFSFLRMAASPAPLE